MSASLASLDPTMDENVRKAPSIRSVASNNSVASAVSLTRRPRARPRSKTVTGTTSTRGGVDSELPYLDEPLVQEPLPIAPSDVSKPQEEVPMRPFRPAQRLQPPQDAHSSGTPSSQNTDLAAAEITFVDSQPSPVFGKTPTKASLAPKSSLPAIQTRYQPPPSAFSRDPSLIPNVRDSVSTHQSATSSSLYPLSSSTASAPESPPSPRSMSDQLDHLEAVRIDSEGTGVQEFDGDDVAYRLQLLVKNNYFLPPAHAKPSPSDFAELAASTVKKQPKSSTPAFLDLFRAVKPKSKPTTPTGSPRFDAPAPMLRATSDSLTAPHAPRTQQPRLSSQLPRTPAAPASRGRVVVVREKMGDIAVAAKQAEQDLKNKGVRLDQVPPPTNQDIFDDVIDPTDAVDVPLPSASYPFAVQASAMHGLGVQDSLGADVLADRLPPPKSPNVSSSFEADSDWRKVLLHQAVHHSLDNTQEASSFSHILGASTPVASPRLRSKSAAPSPNPSHRSGGFFVDGGFDDSPSKPRGSREKPRPILASKSFLQSPPLLLATPSERRAPGYLPARVETPCEPLTPLRPPPRHHFSKPHQSLSQTDLTAPAPPPVEQRSHSSASRHTLRRAQSSPMLADAEPLTRRAFVMTPPLPISYNGSRITSTRTTMSFETSREYLETATTSESMYSDDYDDEDIPRHSMSFSAIMGRPSLSQYSQDSLSPTTSAFQDALNRGTVYSASSSSQQASRASLERGRGHNSRRAPARNSTMSPPPRMPSSLAHISGLPPPPRPRPDNYPYPQHYPRSRSIDSVTTADGEGGFQDAEETIHFNEPEPTTPPVPNSRRSNGLSLDIPRRATPPSIHSAPGPSSATSFFDTIQTHPNAMDDLDSSDESDDDMVEPMPQRAPPLFPPFSSDPRARLTSTASAPVSGSPIMKFGNHSVPYVGKPPESLRSMLLPIGGGGGGGLSSNMASKQPVGNVPARMPFFADRKSDSGHSPISTTYDLYRYTQPNQPMSSATAPASLAPVSARTSVDTRRPSFAGTVASVSSQKAQESFRKLDGMLLQHMETEKDTIKRIATAVKQGGAGGGAWSVGGEGGATPTMSRPPLVTTTNSNDPPPALPASTASTESSSSDTQK